VRVQVRTQMREEAGGGFCNGQISTPPRFFAYGQGWVGARLVTWACKTFEAE
jgi:hypothetical protein